MPFAVTITGVAASHLYNEKPQKMKKSFTLIALLCIIALVSAQNKNVSIDKTFENITDVKVNVIFSDVVVKAAEGNTVSVKGSIQWERTKNNYEIKTRQSGTILIVEVVHPRNTKGNASGEFYITMPAMTDVDISSISGDIMVDGVGQRKVKCNAVSGDITAQQIGSDVYAGSVSGDIRLSNIKGNAKANTVSGDLTLSNIDGNFKGSSVSGDFNVTNLKGTREISTVSGSVR